MFIEVSHHQFRPFNRTNDCLVCFSIVCAHDLPMKFSEANYVSMIGDNKGSKGSYLGFKVSVLYMKVTVT